MCQRWGYWAEPHLGSQLTCIVGLDFLLWVVLDTETQWDHFSLSLSLCCFPFLHSLSLSLSLSRSTGDCSLGLVWSLSRVGLFFLLTVLPIFSLLLPALLQARSLRRSYGSTFRMTLRTLFRHFSRAWVPLEPQHCRRSPRWVPIVSTKNEVIWAEPHLGSQLTCIVGLNFLLWVVLDIETQWDHFSLSLSVAFLFYTLFLSLYFSP